VSEPLKSYQGQLAEMQSFLAASYRQFTPLTERDDLAAQIGAVAAGNDRLTPQEQAEIYREQFWLRHRDVLYDDYPGLAYLLGEEPFEDFLRAYLLACPPNSYTLRDLGNRIADFAATYDGFPEDKVQQAREMARFELSFVDIFDCADIEPLPIERVQSMPPEAWASARLVFHPHIVLLRLSHPVQLMRTAVKKDEEPSRDIAPEVTWLTMWRHHDLRVHYRSISEPEFELVTKLRGGANLVIALDEVAGTVPPDEREELAGRVQKWFKGWALRGWIVDIELDTPAEA
jgi:hypothetical protein